MQSIRSQMFFKVGVLKNFANFTGKHLCWSLFLIKLQAWRHGTQPTQLFPMKFAKFFWTFFYRTSAVAASGNWKTFHCLSIFYYHHDLAKCSVYLPFIAQYSNILLSSFFTSSRCCSLYKLKVKFWLFKMQMEDRIWSPKKYSMKNSYNKNIFYLNEK